MTASTKKTILQRAADTIDGPRQNDYGAPEDNMAAIAAAWSAYLGHEIDALDATNLMVMLKVMRTRRGYHEDSYIDMAGYAAIAERIVDAAEPIQDEVTVVAGELHSSCDCEDGDGEGESLSLRKRPGFPK